MPYHHITAEERVKIEALLDAGSSEAYIADQLGRNRSSVSRELDRNFVRSGISYRAKYAEKRRRKVRREANKNFRKIISGSDLEKAIVKKIKKYWSPEQIAGRMRKRNHGKTIVCHETIYQLVYREHPELKKFFRCRKGKYRRRYGTKTKEKHREEARKHRIDERPQIVESRERIGDFEGDTIVGKEKTQHILTHVDRKSGILFADKAEQATAEQVRRLTEARFKKVSKKKLHTITYDNGVQFAEHETLERNLATTIYFAHPYHSWERGTNENTNGLLRQFFPKGSYFKDVTQKQIERAVKLINSRPRKRLDYRTPLEVFNECCSLT